MRKDLILYCACEGCRGFDKTTPFQSQTNISSLMLQKIYLLSAFPLNPIFKYLFCRQIVFLLLFTIVFFLSVTIVFFPIQARGRLRIQGAVKL